MKEKYDKIIVGAGLSGLITKYFYPDAFVIARHMGGVLMNHILFRLHENTACRDLLAALKIPYVVREAHIGYFYDGGLHPAATREKKLEYYRKSRMQDFPPCGDINSFLTQGQDSFSYLDCDVGELIEKLANNVDTDDMCSEFVKEFHCDGSYVITESGREIHYREMYCTVPAIEFCKRQNGLQDLVPDFKYTPKITQWVQHDFYKLFQAINPYEYVYFLDKEILLLRISNERNGFIHEYAPSTIVCDNFEKIKYGNLLSAPKYWDWPGVYRIGRYANWNQQILISDVVKALAIKRTTDISDVIPWAPTSQEH